MDTTITGIQIQVGLDSGKFESSGVRLTAQAKKITESFNQISGLKADQKLQAVQAAVEKLGGVANLSVPQVARLRGELEKLSAAGVKIPKSLQLPKLDTSGIGGIGKALEGVGAQQLQGLSSSLGPVGTALSAIGPAGLAAAAGIGAVVAIGGGVAATIASLVKGLTEAASKLTDLSAKTQLSVGFLQEIGQAGSLVGVSLDDISSSAAKLSVNIGQGDAIFAKLGLSLAKLQASSPDEQFRAVAEAIKAIPDPATQAAAAMEAFGKGGVELLPLIRSDMAGAVEEARRLGLVLGDDLVGAGDRLDDTLTVLNKQFEALKNTLAGELVKGGGLNDSLRGISETLAGLIKILPESISNLKTLVSLIPFVGPTLGQLGSAGRFAAGKLADIGRFGGIKAPGQEELDKIRNAPQTSLATDLGLDADFQKKLAQATKDSTETTRLATEAKKQYEAAIKPVIEAERELLQAEVQAADGFRKANEGLAGTVLFTGKVEDGYGSVTVSADDMARAVSGVSSAMLAGENRNYADTMKRTAEETAKTKDSTEDWSKALQATANVFQLLGISADSFLGKILGGLQATIAATKRFKQTFQDPNATRSEKFSAGLDIAAVGGGALVDAFKSKSIGKGALKGALAGAAIGSVLPGVGTVLGGLIGGAAGAISGLFGKLKDPVRKAQKEIAKSLGEGISKEFAQQALELSKSLGISLEEAAKKLKVDALKDKLADLQGKKGAAVGQIQAGLGFFGKIKGAADAQGRIFGAQFAAVVKAEGFDKALAIFKATFATLPAEIKAAVPADIQKLFAFGDNEQFAAALDAASALAESFKGTVGLIGLSSQTMADFGAVAQATFAEASAGAIAAGATQEEAQRAALQAVLPLLGEMQAAAMQTGVALDANTQSLIDQAKAAGITIPVDPLLQVVDLLTQIADTLKQIGGMTVNPKVNITTTNTGAPIPTEPGGKRTTGFKTGGIARFDRRGTPAVLHGVEAILPLDDEQAFRRVFEEVASRRPNLIGKAMSEITRSAVGRVPQFATGGFTDSTAGGFSPTGGFGVSAGGSTVTFAPGSIQIGPIEISDAGDPEAVVARLDQEWPPLADALARAVRRGVAGQ